MTFVTVREMKNNLREFWQTAKKNGYVVITNNGKPAGIFLNVEEKDFEEAIKSVESYQFKLTLNKAWKISKDLGNDQMTLDEINQEISKARKNDK